MIEKKGLSLKYFIILLVVVFFVSVIGGTYAYFMLSQIDNDTIEGEAASVDLTLLVNKKLPLVPHSIVPQLSGTALEHAIQAGCVDGNDNGACLVYEITITNDSTASVELDGSVVFHEATDPDVNIEDVIPNLKWMLMTSFDEEDITLSVLGNGTINDATSTSTSFDSNAYIEAGDSKVYYLVVWLDEINSDQTGFNQFFVGDISFVAANGMGVTATFS